MFLKSAEALGPMAGVDAECYVHYIYYIVICYIVRF